MMEPVFVGSKENADDLNRDVAKMVSEIAKIGPRVPEIARRMGRHKETVRYWYKKLEEHDFAIQAITNHEAFGLKRILLKVTFGNDYVDYVKPLMFAMNDLCFVSSYAKALAEDYYSINCAVPKGLVAEYLSFVEDLKQMGVFKSVELFDLGSSRNIPMHGEYYNFANGRWEFDLKAITESDAVFETPPTYEEVKFDKIDLLILKELYLDTTREVQEIQEAIKEKDGIEINYKTLCWHLKEHVMKKKMLKGFRVNWMGTRWDAVTDRGKHRSHSYVGVHFMVKGPTEAERLDLMKNFAKLPLVWMEGAGQDYFAELAVPTEMMIEFMEFLGKVMEPVRERASYHIMDQRNAVGFFISYQLFDEETGTWKFNRQELLEKFRALEAEVRQSR